MSKSASAQANPITGLLASVQSPESYKWMVEEFDAIPRTSALNKAVSSKSPIPQTNANLVLSGAGGAAAAYHSNGGLTINASSSASSTVGRLLKPRVNTPAASLKFGTDEEPVFEFTFTPPAITALTFQIGFVTSRVIDLTTDSYQAKFWFKTSTHATKLYAATSTNHTGTVVDSLDWLDTHLAAGTTYRLGIRLAADHRAWFYVNDEAKLVSDPIDNAGTAVDLIPTVQWTPTAKAAAKAIRAHRLVLGKKVA